MTARYDLLIQSMQEASRIVTIIFGLSSAILFARWSIRFAPERTRRVVLSLFDLWLVAVNLILFVVSQ